MSSKLNQSLDDIVSQRRQFTRRAARPARRGRSGAKTGATPVGGVQKHTKPAKAAEKVTPTAPPKSGEGKVIVSNLPTDVNESQIKEYFVSTIGQVKKVLLTYGANGQSRGQATIFFRNHEAASKAVNDLNGLRVDNRQMRVELVLGAKEIPNQVSPKSLGDRIAKPKPAVKAKPKPATAAKPAGKGGRRDDRPTRAGRGKPKTAEELDAEMVDYFTTENANGDATMTTNGGSVQPATGGDAGMDEIM